MAGRKLASPSRRVRASHHLAPQLPCMRVVGSACRVVPPGCTHALTCDGASPVLCAWYKDGVTRRCRADEPSSRGHSSRCEPSLLPARSDDSGGASPGNDWRRAPTTTNVHTRHDPHAPTHTHPHTFSPPPTTHAKRTEHRRRADMPRLHYVQTRTRVRMRLASASTGHCKAKDSSRLAGREGMRLSDPPHPMARRGQGPCASPQLAS